MKTLQFFLFSFAFYFLSPGVQHSAATERYPSPQEPNAATRPNVIVILADDIGANYKDVPNSKDPEILADKPLPKTKPKKARGSGLKSA